MTPEPASESPAPAQPAPDKTVEPPPAGSSSRVIVTLLLVVLAAAAAVVSFPLWRDQAGFPAAPSPAAPHDTTTGDDVTRLRTELAATTAKLAQMEAKLAPPAAATAEPGHPAAPDQTVQTRSSPADAEIETLTKQVVELRRTAADAATMLRLADRLDQAEAAIRDLQAHRSSAAALLLATSQLREAINLGLAFDAELRTVGVLAGGDGETIRLLDSLKERATTGIAPRAALAGRFAVLAPALLRAEILPEGDGWWHRVMDRLLSLISIRREDGAAAGTSAAAVVARTQAALSRGDLAAAIAEAVALTDRPGEAAAPWLAEAKARLVADKAVSALAAQALALAGAKP